MPRRTDISSILIIGAGPILLFVAGCTGPQASQTDVMAERQAVLDRIADGCGMPRASWKLVAEDTLLFDLGPNPDREKGRCLLNGLRESRLPVNFRPADSNIQIEPVS